MQSPSTAVATHPRREKLSAYERAQIYLAKKQEQEEGGSTTRHRRGLSGHFEDFSEAGDSTEDQAKELPSLMNSGAHLHQMVSTGTSRASTLGSSDWLHAWTSEGDIKQGFDREGGDPDLDKLPGDMEAEKMECEKEEGHNRFSKVKSALKSKLGRSKSRHGLYDSENGSQAPTEGGIKHDPHGIHSTA